MMHLTEAFKKMDLLNEDTFEITNDGLEKLKEFENQEFDDDYVEVIDTEAETEDDISDSYIGQVILDCNVCHSKLYKNKEDVVVEEENANLEEECPFCYSNEGFKVIGEVAPYGEQSEEVEETEGETKEETDDVEVEETENELDESKSIEESFKIVDRKTGFTIDNGFTTEKDALNEIEDKYQSEIGRYKVVKESINESIDDVKKIKQCIQSWITGRPNGGGQNSAYFAKWLAESESGLDWEKIAEVAYSMGYDVYKTSSGYFGDEDYLIVYPGEDPQIYSSDLDDDGKAMWADMKNDLIKVESFNSKAINENINNLSLDTDDTHMEMTSDESGKVTITTEPIIDEVAENEQVIAPVSDETEADILDNGEEEVTDETTEDETVDLDMEEFDEESFDELGESYLKKVYENVNSFKTSNVSFAKDKLIVEGVIKFNSGNSKKTNFIFGIREATKSGKVRFIGENKEISRGRKSFTVTGKITDKKFLSESFNYNYGVKTNSGKVKRLYGTIKK